MGSKDQIFKIVWDLLRILSSLGNFVTLKTARIKFWGYFNWDVLGILTSIDRACSHLQTGPSKIKRKSFMDQISKCWEFQKYCGYTEAVVQKLLKLFHIVHHRDIVTTDRSRLAIVLKGTFWTGFLDINITSVVSYWERCPCTTKLASAN